MLKGWIMGAAAVLTGSGYLVFKTGLDKELFRTISSALTDTFVAIMIPLLKGGTVLLDQLPTIPLQGYSMHISKVMDIVSALNSFVPVVEFLAIYSVVVLFVFVFIVIKLVLKLIPTIG